MEIRGAPQDSHLKDLRFSEADAKWRGCDKAREPTVVPEQVLPGDCIIMSPLGKDSTFQALMRILHDGWSEVSSAELLSFRLKATIFHHSFVPVNVQMCVHANTKAPEVDPPCLSLVVLRDLGRTDVIGFHGISKAIADRLGWFELKVQADSCRACSPALLRSESISTTDLDLDLLDDQDFPDDFDDGEDWLSSPNDDTQQAAHTSTMSMLFSDALDLKDSSIRASACQALARWARSS